MVMLDFRLLGTLKGPEALCGGGREEREMSWICSGDRNVISYDYLFVELFWDLAVSYSLFYNTGSHIITLGIQAYDVSQMDSTARSLVILEQYETRNHH
jgi:hypothetical protein